MVPADSPETVIDWEDPAACGAGSPVACVADGQFALVMVDAE